MSSSLKERLKRSSRLHSSPLSKSNAPNISPSQKEKKIFYSPLSAQIQTMADIKANEKLPIYLREEIENCEDKVKLKDISLNIQKHIIKHEEKLRKLKLVKQHHNQNKPDDLIALTQKWLTTTQDALRRLYDILPEPKPADFQSLIKFLQIDSDLIKYHAESDSFS